MSGLGSDALAQRIAALADLKKAEDIVVLDMRPLVSYTDFLVICTARSERQARSILDEVRVRLKRDEGLHAGPVEGEGGAGWALLDYLDAVLHVFTPEARARYRLEQLWEDAPRVDFEDAAETVRSTA